LLFGALLALCLPAHGRDAFQPYVAEDYDRKQLRITTRDIQHGRALIRIVQARKIGKQKIAPRVCRAWLMVDVDGRPVFERYFGDINPLGASFGLFVPTRQVPKPYFAVVKLGDHDGRLFLIHEDGRVLDIEGGYYVVSEDRKLIFSQYASDVTRVVVFDVAAGAPLFVARDLPPIQDWFLIDGNYVFTEAEWDLEDKAGPRAKEGVIHRFDLEQHEVEELDIEAEDLRGARRLAHTFDPRKLRDCTTPPAPRGRRPNG
jgi:hypothetical protein